MFFFYLLAEALDARSPVGTGEAVGAEGVECLVFVFVGFGVEGKFEAPLERVSSLLEGLAVCPCS